jgi:hypothetical protein
VGGGGAGDGFKYEARVQLQANLRGICAGETDTGT